MLHYNLETVRYNKNMLFNSYAFIFLFLPFTLIGFFMIGKKGHHRIAISWLVGASLFFYGWWNPAYLGLILFSILFNYSIGVMLVKKVCSHEKSLLFIGISGNIVLLGYFKYANFFVDNLNLAIGSDFNLKTIILPLAISFFTFQQIAYLVDAYKGKTREYNFLHYCLFVTFFPQLIAGPIVHHKEMMPQFAKDWVYKLNYDHLAIGITIFAVGLFKKVVLADQFALYATPVFNGAASGEQSMFFEAWFGALAYSLQLYFDFSGYSDMAIGLSRMFNIRLPLNFNSPYKATNIIDFWRRWHITLSAFLREYLYIPLGGNRHGKFNRYRNIMATMLLGGLWHGAGWNFIIWGGLHGAYLVLNHGWRKLIGTSAVPLGKFIHIFMIFLTFIAVTAAWVFFRAENMDAAMSILSGMIGLNGISLPSQFYPFLSHMVRSDYIIFNGLAPLIGGGAGKVTICWLVGGLFVVWILPNVQQWLTDYSLALDSSRNERQISWLSWRPTKVWAVMAGLVLGFALLNLKKTSQFLYFQF